MVVVYLICLPQIFPSEIHANLYIISSLIPYFLTYFSLQFPINFCIYLILNSRPSLPSTSLCVYVCASVYVCVNGI